MGSRSQPHDVERLDFRQVRKAFNLTNRKLRAQVSNPVQLIQHAAMRPDNVLRDGCILTRRSGN